MIRTPDCKGNEMFEDHASESDMRDLAGYKMRIPEAAILQRHLRRCGKCNERYRAIIAGLPDATRVDLVDDRQLPHAR
jgi:hypothetical protein